MSTTNSFTYYQYMQHYRIPQSATQTSFSKHLFSFIRKLRSIKSAQSPKLHTRPLDPLPDPLHAIIHRSPYPVKFPIKTTRIAQYAALAANNSCRAARVSNDMAALNSNVKTMSTPTALNVLCVFAFPDPADNADTSSLSSVAFACTPVLFSRAFAMLVG